MTECPEDGTRKRDRVAPIVRRLATLAGAMAASAALLGLRWIIRGSADPFQTHWPLDLQAGAAALTLLFGLGTGTPFVAAIGVYLGLVAALFVDGGADYPASSLIALAVHGFLPGLAAAVLLWRRGQPPPDRRGNGVNSEIPPPRGTVLRAGLGFLCAVWGSFIASITLVGCQARWYVFQPHPLPLTALFAVLALATLGTLLCGVWTVFRGPQRRRATLICIALVPPVGFWCWVGVSASRNWAERQVPNTFLMRAAKVMGATFMRLEVGLRYRQRLESGRIVMYFDPIPLPDDTGVSSPELDLAMMNEHVERLQKVLGAPIDGRIFWIRGSLLGRAGLSLHGLALGSSWSPDEGSLTSAHVYRGDRHELAHAVLDWFRTPGCDPPYVLHEGWAMSQCGDSRHELAQAAHRARVKEPDVSLRDLFGPTWYHRDAGPVYSVGGAFVEYLIRRFEGPRFRRFYLECTPGRFEMKSRELFQIPFDELEADFWNDVEITLSAST